MKNWFRPGRPGVALLVGGLALAGCGSVTDPEYTADDLPRFPATMLEALPIAQAAAEREGEGVRPTTFGGGFFVTDERGVARELSYRFRVFVDGQQRNVEVDLFEGLPRVRVTDPIGVIPVVPVEAIQDSDALVRKAIGEGILAGVTIPEFFAPYLAGRAAWPEPEAGSTDVPTEFASRVDFLELRRNDDTGDDIWWSTARFYFEPFTGEFLGSIVPDQPQVWSEQPTH